MSSFSGFIATRANFISGWYKEAVGPNVRLKVAAVVFFFFCGFYFGVRGSGISEWRPTVAKVHFGDSCCIIKFWMASKEKIFPLARLPPRPAPVELTPQESKVVSAEPSNDLKCKNTLHKLIIFPQNLFSSIVDGATATRWRSWSQSSFQSATRHQRTHSRTMLLTPFSKTRRINAWSPYPKLRVVQDSTSHRCRGARTKCCWNCRNENFSSTRISSMLWKIHRFTAMRRSKNRSKSVQVSLTGRNWRGSWATLSFCPPKPLHLVNTKSLKPWRPPNHLKSSSTSSTRSASSSSHPVLASTQPAPNRRTSSGSGSLLLWLAELTSHKTRPKLRLPTSTRRKNSLSQVLESTTLARSWIC